MIKILTFLAVVLTSCAPYEDRVYVVSDYLVPNKYCIEVCMHYQFHMFHNSGDSWGAGSSSMAGLSQSKIYDRVKKECVEFYKDEKCCKRPGNDFQNKIIKTSIHGYDFGACVENTQK